MNKFLSFENGLNFILIKNSTQLIRAKSNKIQIVIRYALNNLHCEIKLGF